MDETLATYLTRSGARYPHELDYASSAKHAAAQWNASIAIQVRLRARARRHDARRDHGR